MQITRDAASLNRGETTSNTCSPATRQKRDGGDVPFPQALFQDPFPPSFLDTKSKQACSTLLNLVLEVLTGNEVWDLIIISLLVALLHVLVALSELAEGSEGVGAELVEDARDELSELLVLTISIDGKGVGGNGSVHCLLLSAMLHAAYILMQI